MSTNPLVALPQLSGRPEFLTCLLADRGQTTEHPPPPRRIHVHCTDNEPRQNAVKPSGVCPDRVFERFWLVLNVLREQFETSHFRTTVRQNQLAGQDGRVCRAVRRDDEGADITASQIDGGILAEKAVCLAAASY